MITVLLFSYITSFTNSLQLQSRLLSPKHPKISIDMKRLAKNTQPFCVEMQKDVKKHTKNTQQTHLQRVSCHPATNFIIEESEKVLKKECGTVLEYVESKFDGVVLIYFSV